MFKTTFVVMVLLSSPLTNASDWYQTEKELRIGEREGVCTVVAQMNLGAGSGPLVTSKARAICEEIYTQDIERGHPLQTLMNGESDIVNCMICANSK